jgi:two-component system sensor histidine kinase UhpB
MSVNSRLKVLYSFDKFKKRIHNDVQLALYRIVQEQFTNILKHANASSVTISIKNANGQLIMSVKDDGKGFDSSTRKDGIGLENIKRRAQVFNGYVKIISSPGNGFELIVQIPVGR